MPTQKPSGKLVPRVDRRSGGSGGSDCCGEDVVTVVFGGDDEGVWSLVGVIMLVLVGLELICFDGE